MWRSRLTNTLCKIRFNFDKSTEEYVDFLSSYFAHSQNTLTCAQFQMDFVCKNFLWKENKMIFFVQYFLMKYNLLKFMRYIKHKTTLFARIFNICFALFHYFSYQFSVTWVSLMKNSPHNLFFVTFVTSFVLFLFPFLFFSIYSLVSGFNAFATFHFFKLIQIN